MRQWKRSLLAWVLCLWGLLSLKHVAKKIFGLRTCEARQSMSFGSIAMTAGSIEGLRSLVMFCGLRIHGQGGVRKSCLQGLSMLAPCSSDVVFAKRLCTFGY